jgi:hypothetical protein
VVEVSQLLDLQPLNAMRSTTLGRLLLGEGFLWADLPRYAAGAAIATTLDQIRINISKKNGRAKVDNPTTG